MPVSTRSSLSRMDKSRVSSNFETLPSLPSKKARTQLQIRITNLAVPVRLHIYGFLNYTDIRCPEIYNGGFRYGNYMDPCWRLPHPCSWQEGYHTFRYKPYTIETAFASVIGDCEVLQYLQGMPSNPWAVDRCDSVSCGMSEKDIQSFFYFLNVLVVGYNNMKTLRCVRQMSYPWNEWALDAGIRYGVDLQILKWMHKQGCPCSDSTFAVAASWRNTDVLEWLLNIKCPMSEWTFELALRECLLEHVMWLRSSGCPWNGGALLRAINNKHEDNAAIVEYLLEEQCWHDAAPIWVVKFGTLSHLKLFHAANKIFGDPHLFLAINHQKHTKFLRYLKRIASPWNAGTFALAVKDGMLDILAWLKDEGCPWDASAFSVAARKGDLRVLKWLKEEGCPWDASSFSMAAKRGDLHVLKWLKAEGCPWDASSFSMAAKRGDLSILKWLKAEGCPWDSTVFITAIQTGHREIIRWLYEEKFPMNETAMDELMEKFVYEHYDSDNESFYGADSIDETDY